MMLSKSLSTRPSLSQEDEDLLERSVKKSKFNDRASDSNKLEMVLETQMDEASGLNGQVVMDSSNQSHDNGDKFPRGSYCDMLTGATGYQGVRGLVERRGKGRSRTQMMMNTSERRMMNTAP